MASVFSRPAVCRLLLLAALTVPGCSVPPDAMAPIPDSNTTVYHLGPGDEVRMIAAGEEVLSGQFHVGADGMVDVPLLGPVKAAGLSTTELAAVVAHDLRTTQNYRDPRVAVEVVAYRPMAILGEVNRPGQYPYQPDMTVIAAVAAAGGFTYRAIDDRFAVTRSIGGQSTQGRADQQTKLLPGDVIMVYERQF